MTTAIILQARMGSKRLPGKVLFELEGKTVLEHILLRLKKVKLIDKIIVATTDTSRDLPIVKLTNELGILCFRGDENDVLSRYYCAAKTANIANIVRINSDCPLIDPRIIDKVVNLYLNNKDKYDYVTNILKPTFPLGMHCEVFSYEALLEAHKKAVRPFEREHVTPYIYHRPEKFRLFNVDSGQDLSHHRWTLDYQDDFKFISKIYAALHNETNFFDMELVLDLLNQNVEWLKINGHLVSGSTDLARPYPITPHGNRPV
jgi:spore coat polysaccharide biosynthesis protein SpsF